MDGKPRLKSRNIEEHFRGLIYFIDLLLEGDFIVSSVLFGIVVWSEMSILLEWTMMISDDGGE